MVNFTKRHFLSKAVVGLVTTGLFPFWKKGFKEVIQWQGTLFLPNKMDWKTYCKFQDGIMDVEGLNKIEQKMKNNKSILFKNILFNGKSISWTFIFKSSKDFEKWIKLTEQHLNGEMFKNRYIWNMRKIFWIS